MFILNLQYKNWHNELKLKIYQLSSSSRCSHFLKPSKAVPGMWTISSIQMHLVPKGIYWHLKCHVRNFFPLPSLDFKLKLGRSEMKHHHMSFSGEAELFELPLWKFSEYLDFFSIFMKYKDFQQLLKLSKHYSIV